MNSYWTLMAWLCWTCCFWEISPTFASDTVFIKKKSLVPKFVPRFQTESLSKIYSRLSDCIRNLLKNIKTYSLVYFCGTCCMTLILLVIAFKPSFNPLLALAVGCFHSFSSFPLLLFSFVVLLLLCVFGCCSAGLGTCPTWRSLLPLLEVVF